MPCGQSRETRKRSELAGWATYGYCASHSRYFWGLGRYLLCAPDGMPVSFCLPPANEPEREVAALERARPGGLLTGGEIIIGDKGFAGAEFEQTVASFDATLIRPDRRDEPPRPGQLGRFKAGWPCCRLYCGCFGARVNRWIHPGVGVLCSSGPPGHRLVLGG